MYEYLSPPHSFAVVVYCNYRFILQIRSIVTVYCLYVSEHSLTGMECSLLTNERVNIACKQVERALAEYTEYAVSGVIKQFFKELPESLLTDALTPAFEATCGVHSTFPIESMFTR